jgi:putative DNA methylase
MNEPTGEIARKDLDHVTANYRKKLIEVSLPLAAINSESAREKSIRHGHPSTLHLWWARRPLAACRAVLFSSLVDDPDSDPQYRKLDGSLDEEAAGLKRADLFNLIEELVVWENSNNPDVIRSARSEIARCVASRLIETGKLRKDSIVGGKTTAWDLVTKGHCKPRPLGLDKKAGRVRFLLEVDRLPPAEVVNAFLAEHAPPVLDPFAGGGSIPLEAQRLGLRAYASDLNPVPVLINKALIEIPAKFAGKSPVNPESRGKSPPATGPRRKANPVIEKEWPGATGLAEDVRYYGQWMRAEAEKRIGHLYPKVVVTAEMAHDRPDLVPYIGQQLTVIAWLWARTVASPNPAANGAHVPLIRSFWLSSKTGKKAWITTNVDEKKSSYRFGIRIGIGEPTGGTIGRNGGRCVLTGTPIPLEYIRAEGKAGRIKSRMMAIVVEGPRERLYLPPIDVHELLASSAVPQNVPDTCLPEQALGFRVQNYGMTKHRDLFTPRQLVALTNLSALIHEAQRYLQRTSELESVNDPGHSPFYTASNPNCLGLRGAKPILELCW